MRICKNKYQASFTENAVIVLGREHSFEAELIVVEDFQKYKTSADVQIERAQGENGTKMRG